MALGRSKSSFLFFLTEGSVSNQMLFTRSKNSVPSRSYLDKLGLSLQSVEDMLELGEAGLGGRGYGVGFENCK